MSDRSDLPSGSSDNPANPANPPTHAQPPNRPRTRFQQPGGLPPITRSTRPVNPFDDAATAPDSDQPASLEVEAKAESARPFAPIVVLYATHPPTLTDRLRALYDQAALSMPPPARWDLGVTLNIPTAEVWDQVQAATTDSLRDLLPLTLKVIAVAPTVRDRQEYSVGWTIDPDSLDEVRRARASVIGVLQTITPDLAVRPLDPAILVAESVPALAFPTLIAAMQYQFAPFTWPIESFGLA